MKNIYSTDHNIIQLSDRVEWGQEYVIQVARIMPCGCLSKDI